MGEQRVVQNSRCAKHLFYSAQQKIFSVPAFELSWQELSSTPFIRRYCEVYILLLLPVTSANFRALVSRYRIMTGGVPGAG